MIWIRSGAPDYVAPSVLVPFQGRDLHGFLYLDAHGHRRTRGSESLAAPAERLGPVV